MSLASTRAQLLWLWRHRWAVATVFLATIPVAYMTLPEDWLPSIPSWLKAGLAFATLFSAGGQAVAKIIPKDPAA